MSESEFEGAKRVIAALVRKYGPCELSVTDILTANLQRLTVVSGVDGSAYRYESGQAPGADGEKK